MKASNFLWKRIRNVGAIALTLSFMQVASAQSVTKVEDYGVVTATTIKNGLGFNVNPANAWELQQAAAAGATEVRIQCGWQATEVQTAQNTSGGYVLPAGCVTAMQAAKTYNLRPLMIAAYGPPYHAIVTLKTTTDVPVGTYTIPVTATSGTLAQINVPYCHVLQQNGVQFTALGRNSYAGSFITAVDTSASTLTISAVTSVAIPSGTLLTVNQLLYPSVKTATATDPSIAAYAGPATVGYGGYVGFLAQTMKDYGLTGRVEIWNEPTWAHDPWDMRQHFYDANIPSDVSQALDQSGFVTALEAQTPPDGIRYEWGYTHKSGFNSLLGSRNPGVTQASVSMNLNSESFHPYGNDPEDGGWNPQCLAAGTAWGLCYLDGNDPAANFKYAVQLNVLQIQKYGWGIDQGITETGTSTGDQNAKARFIMREFPMYMALGMKWIDFFQLATPQPGYGFVDSSTTPGTVLQPYLAIKGFMGDVAAISGTATPTFTAANLPTVASYTGYYNLSIAKVTGSTSATVGSNSQMFIAWQRSIVANQTLSWLTMASPAAVPLTITLPAGMKASSATNLTTRTSVAFTQTGQNVTFPIADDAVELLIVPVATLSMTTSSQSIALKAGASSSNTDTLTLKSGGGLNATVTLSCAVAAATGTTATVLPLCTLSSQNVVMTDGTSANVTVGILTQAASSAQAKAPAMPRTLPTEAPLFLAFGVPVLALAFGRKRRSWGVFALALVACFSLPLAGCSSGSSGSTTSTSLPISGTTAGTYNVTVKATANNSGTPISATQTIALTVQ
ncbi:MAG: hypothetical protein PW792_15830 [Acidobacteriaceae bacterium]|nr:hypothetical protein [Acidobacteriaceae bacterium]